LGGQRRIADRNREYLGPSDSGIVMIRRRFLHDLEAVARGEDPEAVIRNPELNRSIRYRSPTAGRSSMT
jgi:5,5'-dehydrodivanillate O-demethylase